MGLTRPAAWAAMLVLAAAPAAAQGTRPERPSRALFGSGADNVSQLLTATGSLGSGFDSSLASDASGRRSAGTTDLDSSGDGIVAAARLSLNYSLDTNPLSVEAAAESAPRYYPGTYDDVFRRDRAVVRGSLRLPYALVLSGSAAYLPYSVFGLAGIEGAPGDVEAPEDAFPVSVHHYFTWKGGLSTSHRLSRRAWIEADATYMTRRVGTEGREFQSASGGGRLRYQVGRNAFLKAGYHYSEADYSGRGNYARHILDVGADYARDLAISRRTTVAFSSRTWMLTYPSVDADIDTRARNKYGVGGSAELRHEMGRTWAAAVAYNRGVQFLETWPEPIVTDSVAVSIDGTFSRRLQFSASARGSSGRSARASQDNGLNFYHGGANLTYALTRYVNVGAQFSTYHHRFQEGVVLPPGFGHWFDRHRFMAQVSFWAPLFSRVRRDNATR